MVGVADPLQEVYQCSPLASPQLVEFPVFPPLQAVLESASVWAFSVWQISAEVLPPQAVHQPVVAHRYSTLVPSAHQPLVPPLRQAVSPQWVVCPPPPEVAPPQLGLISKV